MRKRYSKKVEKHLTFIKLSVAGFLIFILILLPFLVSYITNPKVTLDNRSAAAEQLGPIQSWILSPNGGEIITGKVDVQFFAKNAAKSDAQFTFSIDLIKGGQFVKNLFSSGIDQQIAEKNGIRSRSIDFTGFADGTDYKLKLTTTDVTGKNVLTDYSDKPFTISSNNSKPIFSSVPTHTTIQVGQNYIYDVVVKDTINVKLIGSTLPDWLTLSQNRLSGTPKTPGVYSVALVAVNDLGRQTTQVFSIQVNAATPSQKPQSSTDKTQAAANGIVINLPVGDRLTKVNSKIESILPSELSGRLTQNIIEISKDGSSWSKIYDGTEVAYELDTNNYEGGDYYLRFTYKFDDGATYVKSYGPINIVKQNQDSQTTEISIQPTKPLHGAKIVETLPEIEATFTLPTGSQLDKSLFIFKVDENDLSTSDAITVTDTGISYKPSVALPKGKHTVYLSISSDNAKSIVKEWSFEIVDAQDLESTTINKSILTRNRIIIAVILGLIILIFLLALWAIALSKREQKYYILKEEKKIIEQSPLND